MIRAGLVTAVAAGVGGGLLDEHIAYVTSDDAFRTPFARAYEVLEELPYQEKQLRAALRDARHRPADDQEARRRRRPRGAAQAAGAARRARRRTVVLTRVAGKGTALLVRPFCRDPSPSRSPAAYRST